MSDEKKKRKIRSHEELNRAKIALLNFIDEKPRGYLNRKNKIKHYERLAELIDTNQLQYRPLELEKNVAKILVKEMRISPRTAMKEKTTKLDILYEKGSECLKVKERRDLGFEKKKFTKEARKKPQKQASDQLPDPYETESEDQTEVELPKAESRSVKEKSFKSANKGSEKRKFTKQAGKQPQKQDNDQPSDPEGTEPEDEKENEPPNLRRSSVKPGSSTSANKPKGGTPSKPEPTLWNQLQMKWGKSKKSAGHGVDENKNKRDSEDDREDERAADDDEVDGLEDMNVDNDEGDDEGAMDWKSTGGQSNAKRDKNKPKGL
ncbi:MAG: hypothetical protein M1831_001552 [Alyxoria varia]|nr:MAG: hypothetical protein M1831_001552 [Alyxoria varia]